MYISSALRHFAPRSNPRLLLLAASHLLGGEGEGRQDGDDEEVHVSHAGELLVEVLEDEVVPSVLARAEAKGNRWVREGGEGEGGSGEKHTGPEEVAWTAAISPALT